MAPSLSLLEKDMLVFHLLIIEAGRAQPPIFLTFQNQASECSFQNVGKYIFDLFFLFLFNIIIKNKKVTK